MKNLHKTILIAAMAVAGGATAYHAQDNKQQLSPLSMDNVEALADPEVIFPYICAGNEPDCYDDYYDETFDGTKQ